MTIVIVVALALDSGVLHQLGPKTATSANLVSRPIYGLDNNSANRQQNGPK